jgi:hypothetical protein
MEFSKVGIFLEKVMCRLYGISFGYEEYIDGGFKLSSGILVELVNDYGIDREFIVDIIDSRHLVFRKNPDLCGNLCWYSLVSREVNRVYLAYILERL